MTVVGVQAITYLTISMYNTFYIKFNEFPFVTDKPMRFPAISIITHGMNSVMMLIDFLVIAFPLRILHMVYGMSLAIFFFLFTLIYHLCGGTDEWVLEILPVYLAIYGWSPSQFSCRFGNHYVYPILDWNNPNRCMVTFVGIFLLIMCYWVLLFGLYKLKRMFNRAFSVVWSPHAVGLIWGS